MGAIFGAVNVSGTKSTLAETWLAAMSQAMHQRGSHVFSWFDSARSCALGERRYYNESPPHVACGYSETAKSYCKVVCDGAYVPYVDCLSPDIVHKNEQRCGGAQLFLQAFLTWGVDCVQHVYGGFASAVWQEKTKRLFLFRDHIGIKPLYYALWQGWFIFATEIKAILSVPGFPRAVEQESLLHYLTFTCLPSPLTLFSRIHKVSPGTILQVEEGGRVVERRYWDPLAAATSEIPWPAPGFFDEFSGALKDSIRRVSSAHHSNGLFLSGGIDSCSIGAYLRQLDIPFSAYCCNFMRPDRRSRFLFSECLSSPEGRKAREVANFLQADYYEVMLSESNIFEQIQDCFNLDDEPRGDYAVLPTLAVSRLARKHGVRHVFLGDGGDEVLYGGSVTKVFSSFYSLYAMPGMPLAANAMCAAAVWLNQSWRMPLEWMRRASKKEQIFWGKAGNLAFTQWEVAQLIAGGKQGRAYFESPGKYIAGYYNDFLSHGGDKSPGQWIRYVDLRFRVPELTLQRIDRMTCSVGLEARFPFLDRRFIEFAMRLSAHSMIQGGRDRYALRKIMEPYLPSAVVLRRKQSFALPVYSWLGDYAVREKMIRLINQFVNESSLLDPRAVQVVLRRNRSMQLYYLFVLASWYFNWISPRSRIIPR